MQTIFDQVDGDLSVSERVIIHGMVTGDITVVAGGELALHGMCCGALVVEPGSDAIVHGMVTGRVANRGGKLAVYGMVGPVETVVAGETYVAPSAVVRDGGPKA